MNDSRRIKRLSIAIIGCGLSGYSHLKNFLVEREIGSIVAYDTDRERLDWIANKHKIETTNDYRKILEDEDIDAVVIASPNDTHPRIAIESMRAGKDVFCEKPLGLTLKECRKIVSIARKTNRILHTHFELRHSVIPVRLKEIINSGEIGNIRSLNLIHYRGPFRPTWKGKRKISGGLTLMETCHTVDLFRYLTGCEVKEVFSFTPARVISHYDYPDTEYLTLKMKRGIISHITSCHIRSADYKKGGFKEKDILEEKYGHQYEYNILGTKGSVWYQPLRKSRLYLYKFEGKGRKWRCILKKVEDYSHVNFNAQIHGSDHKEFIRAVLERRDTYVSPEDALKTHKVCFAVEKSRSKGGIGIKPEEL